MEPGRAGSTPAVAGSDRMKALGFVILMSLAAASVRAATVDFAGLADGVQPPGWKAINGDWRIKGEALWRPTAASASYIVLESAGESPDVTVEATVILRRRAEKGWCFAGVAVRRDASNFWHLALIEAPPGKDSRDGTRSVELLECRNGFRNAQNEGSARLVRTVDEGGKFAWEYNHPYRLRIALRGDQVDGIITEPDGTVRTHLRYRLAPFAVHGGRPALCSAQFIAVFDDVSTESGDAVQARPR